MSVDQADSAHHAATSNVTAPSGTGVGSMSLPPVGPTPAQDKPTPQPALPTREELTDILYANMERQGDAWLWAVKDVVGVADAILRRLSADQP